MLVVLADDQRLERHAAVAQDRARLDERVEALLGHEPADAEDAQVTVALRGRGVLLEEAREVGREAVVDEVDVRRGGDRLQVRDVGLGAGDDEARGVELALEPALRVELRRVDVARVAGEGERQAGDAGGQPGDRRRAVREVRVQVTDVGREPVGERDRLDQFLDVDLARAAERRAAVAEGLRDRGPRRAGDAVRVLASAAPQRGSELAEVVQRQRCIGLVRPFGSGRYSGWRLDSVEDRVVGPCSRASTGLITNSFSGTPACSTRWISEAMKVSETRGKPIRMYATDPFTMR